MHKQDSRGGSTGAASGETEYLCQQLVEGSPSALFVSGLTVDGRWLLLFSNSAWLEAMAVTAEPPAGCYLDELLAPAVGGELVSRLNQCHADAAGIVYVAEWNGRWLEVTLTPSAAADGRPARVLGHVRDITVQRRNEERLEQLEFALGKVSEAIYLLDEHSRIRYANGEASRMLGYGPDELLALSLADVDPQWPAERWREAWREIRERGSLTLESTHRKKDGSVVPVEITVTYFVYRGNEYQMSLVRDIAGRKRAEAELRARSEEFRALVEHSPDVIIRYDRELRATYANPAFFKLADTAPADIIDAPLPLRSTVLYAPELYLDKIRTVLQSGQAEELVFKHRSLAGDAWAHARFVPEFDEHGQVVTVLAIGHDVTALKSAERQLHTVVENLPDMITRFDTDGRILYTNPVIASTLGIAPEAAIGNYPPGVSTDGTPLVDLIRAVAVTGQPNRCDVVWQTLQGERHFNLRHVPEVDESGEVVSIIGIAADVNERREAEELQRRLNRELRAVSECNQVLLRASDEAGLLNDICRIICEVAGYRMAWVGYAEPDDDKTVRPVAWAGEDSGYVAQAKLSWSDAVAHGRGPAGIAIRSGTMYYVQDFATDMNMVPWRQAALQRGYHSGIALPLKGDRDEVFGVLLIYSAEVNAITPSEIRLLEELADDLAFGIVNLRMRDEHTRAERELLRINRFLLTLSRCNEALVHAGDETALLQQMCNIVVEVGEFAMAWVGYVDTNAVHKMAHFGPHADDYLGTSAVLRGDELGEKCRPTLRAAQSGDIQVIQDVAQAECPAWRERALAHGFHSAIALPLKVGEAVIGTFNIYASDSGGFGPEEVMLLSELASDLGFGIETLRVRLDHQRFIERLHSSMESTIQALASAVELRDPYTAGHQRRVAQLAAAVARAMNWPEERVQVVYLAGIVHDVGKIAVPAEILSKPGRLSETEMLLVRAHAAAGYDILKPVDFPWPIAEIVRQHHERMDGSGYPQGLHGDDILPEARILAVCDVVEAMTTHRPYRPGMGVDTALQEIERGRGHQFESAVVDACVDVIRTQGFRFD